MSWNGAPAPLLSPVLSSPKPYQVLPTLTMPRPCICRVVPLVSVHAAPGVKAEEVSARAGTAAQAEAASAVASAMSPVVIRPCRAPVGLCRIRANMCRLPLLDGTRGTSDGASLFLGG